MPTYSKTLYVEVEADDEDAAESIIAGALDGVVSSGGYISHVDYDGPIEEVDDV